MNKKILFTILIAFVLFVPFRTQAAVTPDNPFKRIRVEVSFINSEPSSYIIINHSKINRVSVNMRTLVAVGSVILEDGTSLKPSLGKDNASASIADDAIYLEYYTDSDPTLIKVPVSFVRKSQNEYSFVTSPIVVDDSHNTIHYKIIAEDNQGNFGHYPDSTTYVTAGLYTTEQQRLGTAGGTLLHHSGDQTRGDSSITFLANALLTEERFLIQELYPTDTLPSVDYVKPIITYYLAPANFAITSRALMPTVTLYYGDMPPNHTNIEVKWFNGTKWTNVNFINDTTNKTVTINLAQTSSEFGYYAIFDKIKLSDDDYRPLERAFMPGEKIQFRHLQAGDTVTIYNLRGQAIKTLNTPPFEWDGRTSGGGYAESGSYIYQIKVDGKIISGSLAFVR